MLSELDNSPIGLVRSQNRRVDCWINIQYLLEQGQHGAERVPDHGRQVRHNFSLLAQLQEGGLPGIGAGQFTDPHIELIAVNTTPCYRSRIDSGVASTTVGDHGRRG